MVLLNLTSLGCCALIPEIVSIYHVSFPPKCHALLKRHQVDRDDRGLTSRYGTRYRPEIYNELEKYD